MRFTSSLADQPTNIPPQNNNGSVSFTAVLNVTGICLYVLTLVFLYYQAITYALQ